MSDDVADSGFNVSALLDRSLNWQPDARCAQDDVDPEWFFPERGGSSKRAKEVCKRCPVIEQCRDYAIQVNEEFGIFGGLSARERRRLVRGKRSAAA